MDILNLLDIYENLFHLETLKSYWVLGIVTWLDIIHELCPQHFISGFRVLIVFAEYSKLWIDEIMMAEFAKTKRRQSTSELWFGYGSSSQTIKVLEVFYDLSSQNSVIVTV